MLHFLVELLLDFAARLPHAPARDDVFPLDAGRVLQMLKRGRGLPADVDSLHVGPGVVVIGRRRAVAADGCRVAVGEQIAKQKTELQRVNNMLKDGAATQKQADDIEAQIHVLERQLSKTLSTLGNNTATINENAAALDAQIAALDDRIAKCRIVSPVSGTVLVIVNMLGAYCFFPKKPCIICERMMDRQLTLF